MGDFGYIFGYALFFMFCLGWVVGWLCSRTKYFKALKRKPMVLAQMIKILEQIIADWDGSKEELDALIALENTVLYKM